MAESKTADVAAESGLHRRPASTEQQRSYGQVENPDKDSTDSLGSDESDDTDDDFPTDRLQRLSTKSKDYTAEEEQRVVRKYDRRLVLFLALLYLLSFLDRSNIGNARIAGLQSSLNLTSAQYTWLLNAFYITYISFEWMILLYRVIPPHIYISVCVLSWGVIASLQSLATSFPLLLVLRALLGVSEAAFGPGVPFYMTFFYKRSELATRVALQISAAPLATSFASSLAWLIVKLSQNGPLEPWRALFLVEGFPSVLVAVVAYYLIPDSPATTRYLTPRERKVATLRLQEDQSHEQQHLELDDPLSSSSRGLSRTDLLATLLDPKAYLTALMFFSVNVAFSSLPVFLPTVLTSMSFSPLTSQALAAPPYLCAFIFVLLIGRASDRRPNSRGLFIIAVALLSSASYAAIALAGAQHARLGPTATIAVRYAAVFGAACGFFAAVTLIIAWTLNIQHNATRRGAGMAILNVVGQCGPLLGVSMFPDRDAPYFIPGMTVSASFMLGVAVLAAALRWYLALLNRRMDRQASAGLYELAPVRLGREEGEGLMQDDVEGDANGDGNEGEPTTVGSSRRGQNKRTDQLQVPDRGFRFIL